MKWLCLLMIVFISGCSDGIVSYNQIEAGNKLCAPNDGLNRISSFDATASGVPAIWLECKNGAVFRFSLNSSVKAESQ